MTGLRRRGVAAVLATVTALLTATGCANVPSSSRPQVISESAPASAAPEDDDVRYDEIVPRPGESPEDIVRDFLRAAGSYERAHARARAYLTSKAAESWKDDAESAVLEDAPYLNVSDGGAVVTMTARQRGTVRKDGSYVPGEAPYPFTFQLTQVNGNWRIDNPPAGLLIEAGTFEAAYRSYAVYFLDSTRTRVVPDVRWFAASRDTLSSVLVAAIENGPSSPLADAVRSDLEGVRLQNNVEQGTDRVRVYLSGLADDATTLPEGGFAQLVWTLDQVGVGGVEIYADNQLITPASAPDRQLQRIGEWRAFSPDGLSVSAPGYFIRDGAVWTTRNAPLEGPAGQAGYGATSVAVSLDEKSIAVVRGPADRGQSLWVGPPGGPRKTLSARTLSRPTWGAETGEVWTVRNGTDVLLVPLKGQAARVAVPEAGRLGTIRQVRLSRDGARVALVAGDRDREKLWVGVVVRQRGQASIEKLRIIEVGGTSVEDVSWHDALNVVALVRDGEGNSGLFSLYKAGITGVGSEQLVATRGLTGPPVAVAAGPVLPLLTIAAGNIWQAASTTDETWKRVTEQGGGGDSAPAYPG
jgi:hypothetical protein